MSQSNDELNREISEMKEPKPRDYNGDSWDMDEHGLVRTFKLSNGRSWVCEVTRLSFENNKHRWIPRDWTGNEEASAVLLEEMPWPLLKRVQIKRKRMWECWQDPTASGNYLHATDADRKVCIALAWKAWQSTG